MDFLSQPLQERETSSIAASYGYHQTFSTHASQAPDIEPPSYAKSQAEPASCTPSHDSVGVEKLPGYSCDTSFEGFLDMCTELSTPFLISHDNDWHSLYVVLHGTQLHLFKAKKSFFRSKAPRQGRLLRTYSLQHAEIGIALDWRKSELIPKGSLARALPKVAREKLYETDPEMFEPVREFVFRMRVETEQLIFCAPSHSTMLDWIERICEGMDIAPPLDDRNEPRFRSLPRRSRRQRQIEAAAQAIHDEPNEEERQRQFVEEQLDLFRRLYPHLAATVEGEPLATTTTTMTVPEPELQPDNNEFDREDALGETNTTSNHVSRSEDEVESYDAKHAPQRPPMSFNALCRFRRRCAPILLASSPRASHVIFHNGARYQVDGRKCKLIPFVERPPRYESHKFDALAIATKIASSEDNLLRDECTAGRPALARGVTGASQWSNGSMEVEHEEGDGTASVHTTNSASEDLDRIETVSSSSDAISPTSKGKAKAILVTVKKVSASPLKPMPRSYTREEHDIAAVAFAPVLV